MVISDPNALLKANPRFHNHKEIFNDMLKESSVLTTNPVNNCMITYDSKRAVIVSKKDEREYAIEMFDLETYEQTFMEKIGGQP